MKAETGNDHSVIGIRSDHDRNPSTVSKAGYHEAMREEVAERLALFGR